MYKNIIKAHVVILLLTLDHSPYTFFIEESLAGQYMHKGAQKRSQVRHNTTEGSS